MPEAIWESINPSEFSDGVLYVPGMIELQPRQPHWGHPDQPGLRERLIDDRPHGIKGGKLLCLLCMRIQAERGLPPAPVWMTFVEGPHKPVFRHEDGRSPHAEHQPETDTHKALKERKARTWQAAGALEVNVEAWRPRARRRPDVVAVGPELTVAGEVQHSKESPRVIQSRQKSLRKAGDRVVWTTDRGANDISFLHAVPHLAIQDLDDYRLYLREPRLEVGAGAITFEEQRCGWPDIWNGNTPRCPATNRMIPCGRLHLYPTFNPNAYSRRADATSARFPCGHRLHLDHILEGILHGWWLPYQNRRRIIWIPTNAHDDVVAERGGSVERAEGAAGRRSDQQTSARSCERRIGGDQRTTSESGSPAATTTGICCGERPPGVAGDALISACRLCGKSPTYWRNQRRETQ